MPGELLVELAFAVVQIAAEATAQSLLAGGGEVLASAPAFTDRERSIPQLERRVLDPSLSDSERAPALEELRARPFDREQAVHALMRLLDDPSPVMRAAALRELGELRARRAYARIAPMRPSHPEEEAALATALARIGRGEAEPHLWRILDAGSWDARIAAAKALGHVGSLASVVRLLPLASAWRRGELGDVAERSIARIQFRCAKKGVAGAVSLGEPSGGELSPAAPSGAVSHVTRVPE